MRFDPGTAYFWVLDTNKGTIRIELKPDDAPAHVTSVIYLTNIQFYDGSLFYRIVPGFVAQAGCPRGDSTGTGGPGYEYESEIRPGMKHDSAYLVGAVNRDKDTDGSQFYLTFAKTPKLDGKHAIFGEVVGGQDVVKAIESLGTPKGRPGEEVRIVSARAIQERKHYDPNATPPSREIPFPQRITATNGNSDQVLIRWDASVGAGEYRVFRAEGSDGTRYASQWQKDTSYVDRNARPGVKYIYWVQARNGEQMSKLSSSTEGRRPILKSQAGRLPFEVY